MTTNRRNGYTPASLAADMSPGRATDAACSAFVFTEKRHHSTTMGWVWSLGTARMLHRPGVGTIVKRDGAWEWAR